MFGSSGKYFALPGILEILGNIWKYLPILINTIQYWDIRDNICQYQYQQMLRMDSTWQQQVIFVGQQWADHKQMI